MSHRAVNVSNNKLDRVAQRYCVCVVFVLGLRTCYSNTMCPDYEDQFVNAD